MRIKTVRDFRRGDKITYRFPRSNENKIITGTVIRKSKSTVELKIDGQVVLRLSEQHLKNIEAVERIVKPVFSLN